MHCISQETCMVHLLTVVPLQIARVQNNNLVVLRDGITSQKATDELTQTHEVINYISLGLYEELLKSWTSSCSIFHGVAKLWQKLLAKSYRKIIF